MTEPLVIDDRARRRFLVNREVFTSEEILRREREAFFDKAWIYVGHESEVPRRNDFRTRHVAGRPVIFLRDAAGAVRVLLNTCRHRGAQVCREAKGSSKVFTCFYHGWAYRNSGQLVNIPDRESYPDDFPSHELGLVGPPRVASYRGFVFASFDPGVEELDSYLAGARQLLDLVADQSESGMVVLPGIHHYSMRANWKLLMENSCDGYHGMSVHQTYIEMMMDLGVTPGVMSQDASAAPAPNAGIDLGNGHATTMMREIGLPLMSERARQLAGQRRDELVKLHGEEYTARMYNLSRNTIVFPNLAVIDLNFGIQIRTMYPTAPDHTEITGWQLIAPEIAEELKAYRIDNALSFWGPGGLATPDDVAALEQCQRGFVTRSEVGWSDISKGMSKATPGVFDENQMRTFWRRWNHLMTGAESEPEGPSYAEVIGAGSVRSGS
ncbi:MAG TPA: aromatic ring-hydroxylating dioxygenase subunit alpha [Pseudonocardia sp.]|jgi:phenylpropionate dioxygenase-like ring-hydroxylating dioxygenase large terminal subunit